MSLSSPIAILLQTTFVLAVTLLAGLLAQRRPALRSAVYRTGLVATILVALISPHVQLPQTPVKAVLAQNTKRTRASKPAPPTPTLQAVHPIETTVLQRSTPSAAIDWMRLATVAYLTGLTLLLARLALGLIGVQLLKLRGRPLRNLTVLRVLVNADLSETGVFESEEVQIPMVAGFPRPALFLPVNLVDETNPSLIEATVRHEAAHLLNRDLYWILALKVARAFLWPNPLIWLIQNPMAAVAEQVSDAYVLQGGITKRTYASYLLDFQSRQITKRTPSAALGMVKPQTSLAKRVESILSLNDYNTRIPMKATATLAAVAVAFACSALVIFAQRPIADGATPKPLPKDRQLALVRMKNLSIATQEYINDYDNRIPQTADFQSLKTLLGPYGGVHDTVFSLDEPTGKLSRLNPHGHHDPHVFESPTPGGKFVFNPNVTDTFSYGYQADTLPLWREYLPDPRAKVVVAYLDGHIKLVGPDKKALLDQRWNFKPGKGRPQP